MRSGLTLVLDFSASLYMGIVDAEGRTLAKRVAENARGETAHDLLEACFGEAGAKPSDLASLCVGSGPGSFTGIRVGIALAQGLAFAGRLPIFPFSTLAAMLALNRRPGRTTVAAIFANAGRYYTASEEPYREALRTLAELRELGEGSQAPDRPALVVTGTIPDREALSAAYSAPSGWIRLEDNFDFGKVAAWARTLPAVRDGIIRPNYLMASAAEEKRLSTPSGAREAGLPPHPNRSP